MKTLSDIVATTAALSGDSKKDVERILKIAVDTIKGEVANGNEVRINDFGKFSVSERAAREGRNPATGESIQIAASKGVKFSAASAFKSAL